MRRTVLAVLAISTTMTVASAQQRQGPWEQLRRENEQFRQQLNEQEQKTREANVVTKGEPMPYSLEQLLTSGWAITSSSMGPIGTQFVLHMPQRRGWALCDLRLVNGLGHIEDRPVSRCVALN